MCVSVVYLTCTMALGTVSVCLTVLTLNLHHRDPERSVPRWAKIIILNYLSKILCVRARKPKTMQAKAMREQKNGSSTLRGGIRRIVNDVNILRPMLSHNHNSHNSHTSHTNNGEIDHFNSNEQGYSNKEHNRNDSSNDWRELAHVLDRLFFWMVFVCMSASAMIILTVPLYRDHKTKNS